MGLYLAPDMSWDELVQYLQLTYIFFGWMADTYGRKHIIFPTLALALLTVVDGDCNTKSLAIFDVSLFFCNVYRRLLQPYIYSYIRLTCIFLFSI